MDQFQIRPLEWKKRYEIGAEYWDAESYLVAPGFEVCIAYRSSWGRGFELVVDASLYRLHFFF